MNNLSTQIQVMEKRVERAQRALVEKAFGGRYDESKHPRRPKGAPGGGKFAPKQGGAAAGGKVNTKVLYQQAAQSLMRESAAREQQANTKYVDDEDTKQMLLDDAAGIEHIASLIAAGNLKKASQFFGSLETEPREAAARRIPKPLWSVFGIRR